MIDIRSTYGFSLYCLGKWISHFPGLSRKVHFVPLMPDAQCVRMRLNVVGGVTSLAPPTDTSQPPDTVDFLTHVRVVAGKGQLPALE